MADTETGVLSAEYTDDGKKVGHVYDPTLPSRLLRQGRIGGMLEDVFTHVEASMLPEDKGAALELAAKAISKAFGIDFDRALEACSMATHVCGESVITEVAHTTEELRRKWTGKPEPNRDDYDSGLREADAEVRQLRQKQLATAELFIDAKLVGGLPRRDGYREVIASRMVSLAEQLGCAAAWPAIQKEVLRLKKLNLAQHVLIQRVGNALGLLECADIVHGAEDLYSDEAEWRDLLRLTAEAMELGNGENIVDKTKRLMAGHPVKRVELIPVGNHDAIELRNDIVTKLAMSVGASRADINAQLDRVLAVYGGDKSKGETVMDVANRVFTIGDLPSWPLVAELGLAKGSDWKAVDAEVKRRAG